MEPSSKFEQTQSPPLYRRLAGDAFRRRIETCIILPLRGIYDVFSASIAAQRFEGVFCIGFIFAASQYDLPDIGYLNWQDIQNFSTRVRHALPDTHLLVDIEDEFGVDVISANTASLPELTVVSAVMIEDQKQPLKMV